MEVVARSWIHLQELLYEGAWQEPLGRFRSPVVYRGMGNAGSDLKTSLIRLGGEEHAGTLEGHLLRAFRRYAHGQVPAGSIGAEQAVWHLLALAQHHGLPTRLLDFTYSPLVALHFATGEIERFDRDGVVWCVDFNATNALLPEPLSSQLEQEGAAVFTVEMLSEVARTLPDYDALSSKTFAAFYEPPSLDQRIVNQFALFLLLSRPDLPGDVWLRDAGPGLYRRIVIPAALKPEVRDKLDQANVTERVLLPGLDGLSAWLKRYYAPRNNCTS